MKNHIPMRTCVVCRSSKPKKDLLRIVDGKDAIHIDETGRMNGRGAYICKDKKCFEDSIRKGALKRAFRRNIEPEVLEKFANDLEELKLNE